MIASRNFGRTTDILFFVVVIFYNTTFTGIQNKHLEGETAETGQQWFQFFLDICTHLICNVSQPTLADLLKHALINNLHSAQAAKREEAPCKHLPHKWYRGVDVEHLDPTLEEGGSRLKK